MRDKQESQKRYRRTYGTFQQRYESIAQTIYLINREKMENKDKSSYIIFYESYQEIAEPKDNDKV